MPKKQITEEEKIKVIERYIHNDTDIQLKTLSRRVEVFDMKIIMRRDLMIF